MEIFKRFVPKLSLGYLLCTGLTSHAQVWLPDNGNGTYRNPIIFADYSDPDVVRKGINYYLVASSFTCQPGIPVLRSKDLVNWTIIGHVYERLPLSRYDKPQHGQGSWAPSIRYHKGKFYVYFCTPGDGLFMAETRNPAGKWQLHFIKKVAGWEDPCPFWDNDGKAYLLHGKVGAGPAVLHRMSLDGLHLLDSGKLIYQDTRREPVLEGFKFMEKRDGYYYFAAPAGGVEKGWESVFRSKNIYGPYDDRVVLHQGNTTINGPHQGGFVETQHHEWWFVHFQDRGIYGRVVLLEPVQWQKGWPIPGIILPGDTIGEAVTVYQKPRIKINQQRVAPQTSDEFNKRKLGLQWQWQAAPDISWYSLTVRRGFMRLYTVPIPIDRNLLDAGNLLLQKFTAPQFTVATRMDFSPKTIGEIAGLTIMGMYFTYIAEENRSDGIHLVIKNNDRALFDTIVNKGTVWLRAIINSNATCIYAYSNDGLTFKKVGGVNRIGEGAWIGAKTGIFSVCPDTITNDKGYADFDYFRVEPTENDAR